MKIKLLSQIYSDSSTIVPEGTVCFEDTDGLYRWYNGGGFILKDTVRFLLLNNIAEIVKDDIDIEAIREKYRKFSSDGVIMQKYNIAIDFTFYFNYLIVKDVIDQLNGNWVPNFNDDNQDKYQIVGLFFDTKKLEIKQYSYYHASMIPPCKNRDNVEKTVKLCEPELKVLFGVK